MHVGTIAGDLNRDIRSTVDGIGIAMSARTFTILVTFNALRVDLQFGRGAIDELKGIVVLGRDKYEVAAE